VLDEVFVDGVAGGGHPVGEHAARVPRS
jgi:hypothetical protein